MARLDWNRSARHSERQERGAQAGYAASAIGYKSAARRQATVKFRKAPSGEWLVSGPERLVKLGPLDVVKANGEVVQVKVTHVMPSTHGCVLARFVPWVRTVFDP